MFGIFIGLNLKACPEERSALNQKGNIYSFLVALKWNHLISPQAITCNEKRMFSCLILLDVDSEPISTTTEIVTTELSKNIMKSHYNTRIQIICQQKYLYTQVEICSIVCMDIESSEYCTWAKTHVCDSSSYMKKMCRKTCGLCTSPGKLQTKNLFSGLVISL